MRVIVAARLLGVRGYPVIGGQVAASLPLL